MPLPLPYLGQAQLDACMMVPVRAAPCPQLSPLCRAGGSHTFCPRGPAHASRTVGRSHRATTLVWLVVFTASTVDN